MASDIITDVSTDIALIEMDWIILLLVKTYTNSIYSYIDERKIIWSGFSYMKLHALHYNRNMNSKLKNKRSNFQIVNQFKV